MKSDSPCCRMRRLYVGRGVRGGGVRGCPQVLAPPLLRPEVEREGLTLQPASEEVKGDREARRRLRAQPLRDPQTALAGPLPSARRTCSPSLSQVAARCEDEAEGETTEALQEQHAQGHEVGNMATLHPEFVALSAEVRRTLLGLIDASERGSSPRCESSRSCSASPTAPRPSFSAWARSSRLVATRENSGSESFIGRAKLAARSGRSMLSAYTVPLAWDVGRVCARPRCSKFERSSQRRCHKGAPRWLWSPPHSQANILQRPRHLQLPCRGLASI